MRPVVVARSCLPENSVRLDGVTGYRREMAARDGRASRRIEIVHERESRVIVSRRHWVAGDDVVVELRPVEAEHTPEAADEVVLQIRKRRRCCRANAVDDNERMREMTIGRVGVGASEN